MKKSKKLMLLSIGAMSAVAVATGAVSTMAWFQAQQKATAVLDNLTDTSVTVTDGIEIAGMNIKIDLAWTVGTGVTPTAGEAHPAGYISGSTGPTTVAQSVGGVYGVDQNGNVVNVTNAASLVKSETVNVALDFGTAYDKVVKQNGAGWDPTTKEDRAQLDGVTIYVQVHGTSLLRVATSRSGDDNKSYVGAYAGAEVSIGSITFDLDGSGDLIALYTPVLDVNGGSTDESLNFYYSVTTKNNLATGDETGSATYGSFVASLYTPAP